MTVAYLFSSALGHLPLLAVLIAGFVLLNLRRGRLSPRSVLLARLGLSALLLSSVLQLLWSLLLPRLYSTLDFSVMRYGMLVTIVGLMTALLSACGVGLLIAALVTRHSGQPGAGPTGSGHLAPSQFGSGFPGPGLGPGAGPSGPSQPGPGQPGPSQFGSGFPGPGAGPSGLSQPGPGQPGPGQPGPGQPGPGHSGPGQSVPGQSGAGQFSAGPSGPGQPEAARFGHGPAFSGPPAADQPSGHGPADDEPPTTAYQAPTSGQAGTHQPPGVG